MGPEQVDSVKKMLVPACAVRPCSKTVPLNNELGHDGVRTTIEVEVAVGVSVGRGVTVGVWVGDGVGVPVGVLVGDGVRVPVGVGVIVGVAVGVRVLVGVSVKVGVAVGYTVTTMMVGVGVPVGGCIASLSTKSSLAVQPTIKAWPNPLTAMSPPKQLSHKSSGGEASPP